MVDQGGGVLGGGPAGVALAVEHPERVGLQALPVLGAQLVPSPGQVARQQLEVARSAHPVAHRVEPEGEVGQAEGAEEPVGQGHHLDVEVGVARSRGPPPPAGGAAGTARPGAARSGRPGWRTRPSRAAAVGAGRRPGPWGRCPRAGGPGPGHPGPRTRTSPSPPRRCPRRSPGGTPSRPRRSGCGPARNRPPPPGRRTGPAAPPSGPTRGRGRRGCHSGRAPPGSRRARGLSPSCRGGCGRRRRRRRGGG